MNKANKNAVSSITYWNNLIKVFETFNKDYNTEALKQSQNRLDKNFARFSNVIDMGIKARQR